MKLLNLLVAPFITVSSLTAQIPEPNNKAFSHSAIPEMAPPSIESPEDIVRIFPKTAEEITASKDRAIQLSTEQLKEIHYDIARGEDFHQTLKKFDSVLGYLIFNSSKMEGLSIVLPDPEVQKTAMIASVELSNFFSSIFENHAEIYKTLKINLDSHQLNQTEKYLIKQLLIEFEKNGQFLNSKDRKKLTELNQDIAKLCAQFGSNIQKDNKHFFTTKNELKGLSNNVLNTLHQNEDGRFLIGCDYPTYFSLMTTCSNEEIRKKLSQNFSNVAYPDNEEVLNQMILKRDQLAKLLGFNSFAEMDLLNQMVKTPKAASSFLQNLWNQSQPKANHEFNALSVNLPQGIQLSKEGRIKHWDYAYSSHYYKKKHYNIDDTQISEYFPLESTFSGLVSIYEQFFAIKIEEMPISGLWAPDVKLLKVSDNNAANSILGYVLLDLYPRANKYPHACDVPGIVPSCISNGKAQPGLELVVANFTKPTDENSSLLKHREVQFLFHEFGHALHSLFSKNEYLCFAGISSPFMKMDFVELPSQILEEWMWQPEILKMVSSHYKSKKPLPDHLIQKIACSKNMDAGLFVQGQTYLSFLALNYFSEGESKNLNGIARDLSEHLCPQFEQRVDSHKYLSFVHLTNYGPKYYGYLWSKVFALDIFEQIKKEGILNPKVGVRYRQTILEKGASVDPNILLENFLGRAPSQEAFIRDLSLDTKSNDRSFLPL